MGILFDRKPSTYAPPPGEPKPTMLGPVPLPETPASPGGRTAVVVNLPGLSESTYLDSEFAPMVDAFIKYAREAGHELTFSSGYRSPKKQQDMITNKIGITPAPNSLHKAGLAVDVNFPQESALVIRKAAERAGLSWGGTFKPISDPVHFYFDPIPNQDRTELIDSFTEQVRRLEAKR